MKSRRNFLSLCLGAVTLPLAADGVAGPGRTGTQLRAGEFKWHPEKSPEGPVTVIVSLPEQLVHIYRGGIEIGVSTCSSGRPGHRTPTGVFTILEKQRDHVSSIYKGAQMPNMERLTWGGIALHAGNLPGYPASHGCVRLPRKFSELLYGVTHIGTIVIIADERTQPREIAHPGALLSEVAESEVRAISGSVAEKRVHSPWEAKVQYPITSVVISRGDGLAYVTRDRDLVGSYPVDFSEGNRPIGTHTYSLIGPAADGSSLLWLSFGIGKSRKDAHIVSWQADRAMKRVVFRDRARAQEIARTFHAGTTLLITDARAPRTTRSTPDDFSVLTSEPVT
ncbi:MAG: L,D-transpeptidase family protein [Hyphomicrobiaceae bacterium]